MGAIITAGQRLGNYPGKPYTNLANSPLIRLIKPHDFISPRTCNRQALLAGLGQCPGLGSARHSQPFTYATLRVCYGLSE